MKIYNVAAAIALSAATLGLSSCGATRQAVATETGSTVSNSGVSTSRMRGYWNVTNVAYSGVNGTQVRGLFGDANPDCFLGSRWILNGNGLGSYQTNGTGDCPAVTQNISWAANAKTGSFSFKKLHEGDKAIKVTSGYVMQATVASDGVITLQVPVDNNGTTGYVLLTLSRSPKAAE